MPFTVIETGYLITEIYEETSMYLSRIYEVAYDVFRLIQIWNPDNDMQKQIRRCRMLSGSAYSMLHTDTREPDKKKAECRNCLKGLQTAKGELKKCKPSKGTEEFYQKRLTRALIHGNYGAYYRTMAELADNTEEKQQYLLSAEEEHRKGLKKREKLEKEYPLKKKEIQGLKATSHHCLGRDFFSMGKPMEALKEYILAESLRRSLYEQDKEKGQKAKWIQSCEVICDTVCFIYQSNSSGTGRTEWLKQSASDNGETVAELYHRCFRAMEAYYQENQNRRGMDAVEKNRVIMEEFKI